MSWLRYRTAVAFLLLQATSLFSLLPLFVAEAFVPTPLFCTIQESACSSTNGAFAHVLSGTSVSHDQSIAPAVESSIIWPASSRKASIHWSQLMPRLWQNERGVDIRQTWNPNETPSGQVAREMMNQAEQQFGRPLSQREELEQDLTIWTETFTDYCINSLQPSSWEQITARIVSSRGPVSTKCPRWHLDHVPFRWIQSLLGPGCLWVDAASSESQGDSSASEIVNQFLRESEGNDSFDDSSAREANQRRINPSSVLIQQASPGEPVLLLGKGWAKSALSSKDLPPVIHKSPDGIMPWEGRILLTIDIIEPPI